MKAWAVSFGVLLGIAACAAYEQPCACGGKWADLFGPAKASPTVQHVRSDHCSCQCGDDQEAVLTPPFQEDCAAFEIACTTSSGKSDRYACR